jgi:hypothetical protein
MARFLSPDWFDEVGHAARPACDAAGADDGALVLEQVVRDTPDGEVRYRVVVTSGRAYIERPSANGAGTESGAAGPPDLRITCDWSTAAAMAQGLLSAQAALLEGRLRVKGDLARLSGRAADLAGLDPVPEAVRRQTTY